jgi:hypothetical protein
MDTKRIETCLYIYLFVDMDLGKENMKRNSSVTRIETKSYKQNSLDNVR